MKKKTNLQIQQGDVLIFGRVLIPANAQLLAHRTLRLGEHTGHSHIAVEEDVQLFIADGVLYMRVPDGGTEIVHQEHNPISVPAGDYQIGAVQEFDYDAMEARPVQD